MKEYWVIAISLEKSESHRQYAKKIEAESDEDAWEIASEWFNRVHGQGHQFSHYEYFVTRKISK
jgi:hypothetical protein